MKYLKYFESLDNLKPNDFDTECLEEVKSIFNEFAEENDFYQFDWTLDSHPLEVGIHYAYTTFEELENLPASNVLQLTDPSREKLAIKISNDMLSKKYFNIQVNINEEMKYWKEYGSSKCSSRWDEITQKINDQFIKRIESIGYKVKISNGSSSSLDIWTDIIELKIDYSEL
jgi:hypothetical protein